MRAYTQNEYRSEKKPIIRMKSPNELIRNIQKVLGEKHDEVLRLKYSRESSKIRAFTTYLLRILCGYTYKGLCEYIGNMSMSGMSRLSNEGFKLLSNNLQYRNIFNSLVQQG